MGLNREGGLFKILAQKGGVYERGGLNREKVLIELLWYLEFFKVKFIDQFNYCHSIA